MFDNVSTELMLIMMAGAAAAAFFVGNAMDTVLGSQGFGVFGNMVILLSGFAVGMNVAPGLPSHLVAPTMVIPAAIAFGFLSLFMLALIKRLVQKV